MRGMLAALGLALMAEVPPASAIEVCRANNLGMVVCRGQPTRGLDPITPFPPRAGRVAPPLPHIPEARTNAFGDTLPRADQTTTGRPRPRVCRTDNFGNMRC